MRVKPQQYAEMLVESAKPENVKKMAAGLWHSLQKNKQYKDLPRILELLDVESAKKENKVLAKVYSEKKLSDAEIKEIEKKLVAKHPDIRYSILEIRKKNWGGITVEVEGKIIDLSLEGTVNKLKRKLSN